MYSTLSIYITAFVLWLDDDMIMWYIDGDIKWDMYNVSQCYRP